MNLNHTFATLAVLTLTLIAAPACDQVIEVDGVVTRDGRPVPVEQLNAEADLAEDEDEDADEEADQAESQSDWLGDLASPLNPSMETECARGDYDWRPYGDVSQRYTCVGGKFAPSDCFQKCYASGCQTWGEACPKWP